MIHSRESWIETCASTENWRSVVQVPAMTQIFLSKINIEIYFADNKCLKDSNKVKSLRQQLFINLEDYINDNQYTARGRSMNLVMLFPKLQSISMLMIEQMKLARLFGVANTEGIIQEMLLYGKS